MSKAFLDKVLMASIDWSRHINPLSIIGAGPVIGSSVFMAFLSIQTNRMQHARNSRHGLHKKGRAGVTHSRSFNQRVCVALNCSQGGTTGSTSRSFTAVSGKRSRFISRCQPLVGSLPSPSFKLGR